MPILDKIKDVFHKDKSSKDKSTDAASESAPAVTPVVDSEQPAPASASAPAPAPSETAAPAASTTLPDLPEKAAFDESQVKVVFVLGGPGAGKGTQCERLVRDYGFKHLSAGDLLRAEQQREGSTYGAMIKEYITEGKIVPMEVTIKLLENAMRETLASPPTFPENSPLAAEWENGKGLFLIDGFPRKMDQALKFDEASSFVLFFATTEEVMLERLLERGKTSGRDDDNRESITKRFRTFIETSMPVVDYYRSKSKVEEVDSSPEVSVVYTHVQKVMQDRLGASIKDNNAVTGASTVAAPIAAVESGQPPLLAA